MKESSKIYVAGHAGMVGSAVCRFLTSNGYSNVVTRTSAELDLRIQSDVSAFFEKEKPDYVFVAAAKVGGIHANEVYPADFLYDNLMIASNVIHYSHSTNVKRLMFFGSSCMYPKYANQPITEDQLLTGLLEPTNEPYAVAKIAGVKLCQTYKQQFGCDFLSIVPTNLFGLNDTYHPENGHVIPSLIRRLHDAKIEGIGAVCLWGTGTARREFLFADDLAEASVFLMNKELIDDEVYNIGTGKDMTIAELAALIAEVVGYRGVIEWDSKKPDGTPRKLLDVSKLRDLGWVSSTPLRKGLELAYSDFQKKIELNIS
ncbi:MAG: GDP-L-fucose synthase [Psychroserpens sp.]|jgi:GDP-L-fucose synthase